MNELVEAYGILELEPGASMKEVTAAHQKFIHVWHPDRVPEKLKAEASDRLKKYNHARDVLRKHFQSEHKESGCFCKPVNAQSSTGHASKQPFHEAPAYEEESEEDLARARDEARRKEKESESSAEQQSHREDIEHAIACSRNIDMHEKLVKLSSVAAIVFALTMLLSYTNKVGLESKLFELNQGKSVDTADYFQKLEQYSQDKENYLRQHLSKDAGQNDAIELKPPFEIRYRNIANCVNREIPVPDTGQLPPVTETERYEQDQDKDTLKALYVQSVQLEAAIEYLSSQERDLERARLKGREDPEASAEIDRVLKAIRLILQNRREDYGRTNGKAKEIERRLLRQRGKEFLPEKSRGEKSRGFVIMTEYDQIKSRYPQYF